MAPTAAEAGVKAVPETVNIKLGAAAATYVSQASCPTTCPFLNAGCYAEYGPIAWAVTDRLNEVPASGAVALARAEAEAVDRLPATRDLRLHVVGDSRTRRGTRLLAQAAVRYLRRARKVLVRGTAAAAKVWTYTHAWRRVDRADWGPVSVLASCSSPAEVRRARARGYACALVVPRFERPSAYDHHGLKLLPCPHQTRGTPCTSCRLCLDDRRLAAAGLVVGFTPHGPGRLRVAAALKRINLPVV